MTVRPADFDFVASIARRGSAIVLDPGKEYLVESRLLPLAREQGCATLTEFVALLRRETFPSPLHSRVIDALTTNETYFFRDIHPFEVLRTNLIPELIEKRAASRRLTIWSCACSTGQEAYSVAMILHHHFPQLSDWQIEIFGTDISPRVIEQATRAEYNQVEVNRGLPAPLLVKYFTQENERWIIREEIRRMVQFKLMNLIQPWPVLPTCDIILLRNVLIYFDVPTKQAILVQARKQLATDGHLFLGSAETTINLDPAFKLVSTGRVVTYQAA